MMQSPEKRKIGYGGTEVRKMEGSRSRHNSATPSDTSKIAHTDAVVGKLALSCFGLNAIRVFDP